MVISSTPSALPPLAGSSLPQAAKKALDVSKNKDKANFFIHYFPLNLFFVHKTNPLQTLRFERAFIPTRIPPAKLNFMAESESDGKIEVEIYPNSSLFGDQDEYQNLVSNNVQFIAPDLTKFVGNNPQFNVPALPFMFENDEEAIAFWDGEKGQEILSSLENDGVLGLKMWPNGGKHLTNNERPIESPDDLKGLKFRTQGGQVLEALYSELGAGSESIPFSELYTALDQGVVDGQENTFSNIESKKFDEVQKYMTVMNHTRVDYAVFTNTEFWEGMNAETKEIVEAGLEEGTKVAREEAINLNKKAYDLIKERGETEITELTIGRSGECAIGPLIGLLTNLNPVT
jgi:C4-dicarboxylate-binding protein DctP